MSANEWVIQFAPDQGEAVAAFRHASSARILVEGAQIWIRGEGEQIDREARRKMAADARHFQLVGSHLILEGQRVPTRELPAGNWQPLNTEVKFELPQPARGQHVAACQAHVTLVRQPFSADIKASMVLLSFSAFADYIEMAPEVRFKRWSFLISASGECLVRGAPLPPLTGVFFVEHEKVVMPLGYTWSPRIDAPALRRSAGAGEEDLLLWRENGECQLMSLLDFSRVSRAVVRAAREAASHG